MSPVKLLLAGCALIALQSGPAIALTEPTPMDASEAGDARILVVNWRPGRLIRLDLAKGQPTVVEIPRGMTFDYTSIPEQNIIRDTGEYAEDSGQSQATATANNKELAESGCSRTVNIMVCVRRDRFLYLTPLSTLDKQSLPILAVEKPKTKNGQEIENVIIFQISTAAVGKEPYYGVKLLVEGAPSQAVARPAPIRRSWRDRAYVPPVAAAPPTINNNYEFRGDKTLLGR